MFLIKAQSAEIKTFTHTDNPVTISARWERVSDAELLKHAEELDRKAQQEHATPEPFNVAWKIDFSSSHPEVSNYLGWIWCRADTNLYTLRQWGNPGVYDARLVFTPAVYNGKLLSKHFATLFYGNNVEYKYEERALSHNGGEMKLLKSIRWWRCSLPKPELPQDPPVPRGQSDRFYQFTYPNNPISITACWEDAPARRGYIEWKFHFWTGQPNEANYLGWFPHSGMLGQFNTNDWGQPVIYGAMLVPPGTLLVVHGNDIETWCDAREIVRRGDYMDTARHTNSAWRYMEWPRSWQQLSKPVPANLAQIFVRTESVTNLTVAMVTTTGLTNTVTWHGMAGWTKIAP